MNTTEIEYCYDKIAKLEKEIERLEALVPTAEPKPLVEVITGEPGPMPCLEEIVDEQLEDFIDETNQLKESYYGRDDILVQKQDWWGEC